MKEIKIPIISGLSIAATLALMPIQVLAKNGEVTVTTDGNPGNFYNSSGKNFSGGFESSTNAHGKNDNNIVTINGVNSGGQAMWDYTIYGGATVTALLRMLLFYISKLAQPKIIRLMFTTALR